MRGSGDLLLNPYRGTALLGEVVSSQMEGFHKKKAHLYRRMRLLVTVLLLLFEQPPQVVRSLGKQMVHFHRIMYALPFG